VKLWASKVVFINKRVSVGEDLVYSTKRFHVGSLIFMVNGSSFWSYTVIV